MQKTERENVISWSEGDVACEVETCNAGLIKKLDNLSERYGSCVCVDTREIDGVLYKRYRVDKRLIVIRKPYALSDIERTRRAEGMKRVRRG